MNDVRSSLTVRQEEGSLKCWENGLGMKQVLCKVGEEEYYRNRLKLTGRTGGPAKVNGHKYLVIQVFFFFFSHI